MKKICGIYKITCLIDNKVYIGQSSNINRRWTIHKNNLKKKKHENPKLQNYYNKYGETYFTYEIVEIILKENLSQYFINQRECYWMDRYEALDKEKGFNLSSGGSHGNNFVNKTKEEMIELKQKTNRYGVKNGRATKIICLSTMKIFQTISEASEEYSLKSISHIAVACKGIYHSCGKHPLTGEKLRWMYYDDYIKLQKID